MKRRSPIFFGKTLVVSLLIGFGLWGCSHEFHSREIIPGQIIISSQPTSDQLLRLISSEHLRSVLNLRSEDRIRFREEENACIQAGTKYFACAIPLEDWTPRPNLLRLVEILDSAPRPLLMHCRNGVDRSGLAAAVALLLEDHSLKEAWEQMPSLSRWRARHGGRPLARVLLDYESFLSRKAVHSSGSDFRHWIEERYCPEPYQGRLVLLGQPPTKLKAPGKLHLKIRVENLGSEAWTFGPGGVAFGLRLSPIPDGKETKQFDDAFQPGNTAVIDCGRWKPTQPTLAPGAQVTWDVDFRHLKPSGEFLARIDLLRDGGHWFSDMGRPAPTWKLKIAPKEE